MLDGCRLKPVYSVAGHIVSAVIEVDNVMNNAAERINIFVLFCCLLGYNMHFLLQHKTNLI